MRFSFTLNLLGVTLLVPWRTGALHGALASGVVLATLLTEWAAIRQPGGTAMAPRTSRLVVPLLLSLGTLAATPDARALFAPVPFRFALASAVLLHVIAHLWCSPRPRPRLVLPRGGGLLLSAFVLCSAAWILLAPPAAAEPAAVLSTLGATLAIAWVATGPLPRALRRRRTALRNISTPRLLAWVLTAMLGGLTWWLLQARGTAWRPPRPAQPRGASPAASTASPSSIRRIPSRSSDSVLAWMRRSVGTKEVSNANSPSSSRTSA